MLACTSTTLLPFGRRLSRPGNAAAVRRSARAPLRASGCGGEGCGSDGESSASALRNTIASIDLLTGVQKTDAAQPAALPPAVAASTPATEPAAPVPPEWASLPSDEQQRRQLLVQRRTMLALRQVDLQRECGRQQRKLTAQQQRLASLQLQVRQLSAQQKELGDMIDPEAAAAMRQAALEAAQRSDREGRRDVFILLGCIIGLYGVAATSVAHEMAERKLRLRDAGCFLEP